MKSPARDTNGALPINWQRAFAEHSRWLRAVVFARVREPDGVDEVMQEIALAAVRQAAPLHDASKVGPWLYRLAIYQSLLYRRKWGRLRKLTERLQRAQRDPDPTTSDPLNWLMADERRQQVRVALDRLPRRDAEILLLKYTEGWTYEQISQHLGIGESAVEARLHRARRRMREILAQMNVIEVNP